VANSLAASGLTEVLNYPFVSQEANGWFNEGGEPAVRLTNPIQSESGLMRLSLLPNLLEAAKRNLSRGLSSFGIFEIGSVFKPSSAQDSKAVLPAVGVRPTDAQIKAIDASLPTQPKHFAAVFIGDSVPEQVGQKSVEAGYQDAVQAIRLLSSALGIEIQLEQSSPKGFHPGRSANIVSVSDNSKQVLGSLGELDPQLAPELDLPRRVGILELNLDALLAAAPAVQKAAPVWVMTAATQVLSLVVGVDVPAETVREVILRGAGELLESAVLTDDYRGENLEPNTKSLTFALRFRAEDRTLTQLEASEARDAAVALAEKELQASIRK
jgi:phenylalanyl-tRNA synthetase beta chain